MSQDVVAWQENVRGWSVVVDRTIDNSCFIISELEDNFFVRFQYNAVQQSVQVIVASTNWSSLKTDKTYDLEVSFGEDNTWPTKARGYRWNDVLPSLILSFPVENQQAPTFMRDFTTSAYMRISFEGSDIADLPLIGAHEAVASMLECQVAMSDTLNLKSASKDPFARETDPI